MSSHDGEQGGEGSRLVSDSLKDVNPIHSLSCMVASANPHHVLKAPPPNVLMLWGGRGSTYGFWRGIFSPQHLVCVLRTVHKVLYISFTSPSSLSLLVAVSAHSCPSLLAPDFKLISLCLVVSEPQPR